jgi:ABC-type transport system involved in multi-copper enzyme maturation permease subunit
MLALLKKDWRTYRSAVVGSIVALGCAWIPATAIYLLTRQNRSPEPFADALLITGGFALILTVIVAAVFGGLAFAPERRDHSADFLAMLPTTRAQIIRSKLIIPAAWLSLMILFSLTFIVVAYYVQFQWRDPWRDVPKAFSAFALGAADVMMLFGMAWCLSSFLTSPAISACVSIGVAAASITAFNITLGRPLGDTYPVWCLWAMFVGITTFTIGTRHYLRRVEP